MTNGWLFLGITAFICIGALLNGVRFARMTNNPWANRKIGSMPVEGGDLPVSKLRRFGRIQMIAAPLFLVFFATLAFGLFGPVDGIQTIKF